MDNLKWKVKYRNALIVAAFSSWDDANKYINAKEHAMMKDRLTIEEI